MPFVRINATHANCLYSGNLNPFLLSMLKISIEYLHEDYSHSIHRGSSWNCKCNRGNVIDAYFIPDAYFEGYVKCRLSLFSRVFFCFFLKFTISITIRCYVSQRIFACHLPHACGSHFASVEQHFSALG